MLIASPEAVLGREEGLEVEARRCVVNGGFWIAWIRPARSRSSALAQACVEIVGQQDVLAARTGSASMPSRPSRPETAGADAVAQGLAVVAQLGGGASNERNSDSGTAGVLPGV
jgi:hypothetical protein